METQLQSLTLEEEEEEEEPYRSHLHGEGEKKTAWRHGAPPSYHLVNNLFQDSRTQAWERGSLEEIVQNLVKSWEMELSHKTNIHHFKTIHPLHFTLSVNGGCPLSAEETLKQGSYNVLLATTLPQEHESYKASMETFESSHDIFKNAFPGGFAWEVIKVYSGPPLVVFKWRHWGIMEGAFKGHAPTHQQVESFGICVAKVDSNLKIMDLEVYYDPTQFLGALTKGPKSDKYKEYLKGVDGCPFSNTDN